MTKAGLGTLLLLALALSGCEIRYHRVSETFKPDPTTGHTMRVTTWEYADGQIAYTTDDMNPVNNEVRRTEPPQRTAIFDPF